MQFRVQDPSFRIDSDGAIVALAPVSVATEGRTFSVWVQDNSGPESEMEVHLVRISQQDGVRLLCINCVNTGHNGNLVKRCLFVVVF